MPGGRSTSEPDRCVLEGLFGPNEACLLPFAAAQGPWEPVPALAEGSRIPCVYPLCRLSGAQRPDRSGRAQTSGAVWILPHRARGGLRGQHNEKTSTATRAFVKRTKRFRILQLLGSDSIPRKFQHVDPTSRERRRLS